jgi:NAD(P)H-hydrate epimerase
MFQPLSRDAIREIDRRAIEEFGLPGVVLMENAGRGAADSVRFEAQRLKARRVAVVCGGGNNGGDGFVVARHLANHGLVVEAFLAADPARLSADAAVNHRVAVRMGLPVRPLMTEADLAEHLPRLGNFPIVVDALLGTGFAGAVRPPLDRIIRAINELDAATVIAIDVPSGLDCETGVPADPTIRAATTVTFVAPKIGFSKPGAAAYVGRICVVDIGVPRSLIEEVARRSEPRK